MATQYQEDLPVVRPLVPRFDIDAGHCSQCRRRRVQGRHALQTSDALGAASVQLGPEVVALVVELHTHLGVPLAKVAHLLRTRFGLTITPGGLAQVLHRAARHAAPTYTALCEQVRDAPVVTPDETGWRVGGERHWLWVFATPDTTVYAICPGRAFDGALAVLKADFNGVLIRDGWAPYRRCTRPAWRTCCGAASTFETTIPTAPGPFSTGHPPRRRHPQGRPYMSRKGVNTAASGVGSEVERTESSWMTAGHLPREDEG